MGVVGCTLGKKVLKNYYWSLETFLVKAGRKRNFIDTKKKNVAWTSLFVVIIFLAMYQDRFFFFFVNEKKFHLRFSVAAVSKFPFLRSRSHFNST